jgi:hypothetical protein
MSSTSGQELRSSVASFASVPSADTSRRLKQRFKLSVRSPEQPAIGESSMRLEQPERSNHCSEAAPSSTEIS